MMIQEIAQKIGVSRNTVSKVLHNKAGVSEKLQQRVLKAAAQLGYEKLSQIGHGDFSGSLGNKVSNVSIMVTNPGFSQYLTRIINGIAHELQKTGFNLMYHFIHYGEDGRPILPTSFREQDVSGIIAMSLYDKTVIHGICRYSLPVVYYDTSVQLDSEAVHGDVLYFEGQRSVCRITEHLIDRGATEIGFIGDITYCRSIYDRWLGYQIAMKKHGLDICPEYCLTESSIHHFYDPNEVENRLETLGSLPQAFVCANDVIAQWVVRYCRSKGVETPGDILISGYDNFTDMITNEGRLTSVDTDIEYLGKRLVAQLFYRMKNPDSPNETIQIESRPVFRDSTGERMAP